MNIRIQAFVALFIAVSAGVAMARPISHIEPLLTTSLDTSSLTATIQPPQPLHDLIPLECAPVELTGDSGPHAQVDELELLDLPEDNLICWWTGWGYFVWRGGW